MINKKDSQVLVLSAWMPTALQTKEFGKKPYATLIISDEQSELERQKKSQGLASWTDALKESSLNSPLMVDGKNGPVLLSLGQYEVKEKADSWPELQGTRPWAAGRFKAGEAVRLLETYSLDNLDVQIFSHQEDFIQGILCGLEVAQYSFKGRKTSFKKLKISLNEKALGKKDVQEASAVGHGVNWARHLVNLPPNELNPIQYANLTKTLFQKKDHVKVEVWDEKKLKTENCRLHLAVGSGSNTPPRLVILRYRPPHAKKGKPMALVGKGITFDTGGLDLKPASGMRLMKKDMGGSAAVLGAMLYAVECQLPIKIDAYLALAENSVSSTAFRPSDLIQARNGKWVEIHNTDAEGRLVLADALDVATTRKSEEQPLVVVDVATLTGAIKVALGSQVAGLFSNQKEVSQDLFQSFTQCGDEVWPMPLYQKYRSQMNSPFADMTNSVDGFGGAVTAALFLESFVNEVPWAHLDIYAWKDSPEGAFLESGGSGQAVQGLIRWLKMKS